MFVGAVSCLFRGQIAADIYVSYAWTAAGHLLRIATVTLTYGLTGVFVQRGIPPQPGVMPNQWFVHPASLLLITVTDHGPQHLHVHGAPAQLPNAHLVQGPQIFHNVNGAIIALKALLWHHRVTLEHAVPGTPLHYHQHARRRGHADPPAILPQGRGSYKQFMRMTFSTQVQNCRRIQQ